MTPTLPDQIRAAIRSDGRSVYALAKAAGLEQRTLGRFANGERDLTGERLGRLMAALGLRVTSHARDVQPTVRAVAGRRPKASRPVADSP
jgi:transcriptional regulator with XRE-family HTH domain